MATRAGLLQAVLIGAVLHKSYPADRSVSEGMERQGAYKRVPFTGSPEAAQHAQAKRTTVCALSRWYTLAKGLKATP